DRVIQSLEAEELAAHDDGIAGGSGALVVEDSDGGASI
ncbi:hypothetical protein A2U01_0056146, partial [Trifolium medium]|nr:hypothetical protein [Trifolium medium]